MEITNSLSIPLAIILGGLGTLFLIFSAMKQEIAFSILAAILFVGAIITEPINLIKGIWIVSALMSAMLTLKYSR